MLTLPSLKRRTTSRSALVLLVASLVTIQCRGFASQACSHYDVAEWQIDTRRKRHATTRTGLPWRTTTTTTTTLHISSGLTFKDGNQILVSVQKPLGIVLEQDTSPSAMIRIADMDPSGSAAAAGLQIGDVLVAVQNANMVDRDLDYALQFIAQAPKVLNLRFVRNLPSDKS